MADSSVKPMRQQVEEYILALQDEIVSSFEALDPNSPPFKRDSVSKSLGK
jgi:coproporphyrinogen III oxidase